MFLFISTEALEDAKSFDLIPLAAGALLISAVLWLCIVACAIER